EESDHCRDVTIAYGPRGDRVRHVRPTRPASPGSSRILHSPYTLVRSRAPRAPNLARLVVRHRARRRRHGAPGLQLTRYDEKGWRATFYTTGMEHSPTRATGTRWERPPWHATQRAAWEALKRAEN